VNAADLGRVEQVGGSSVSDPREKPQAGGSADDLDVIACELATGKTSIPVYHAGKTAKRPSHGDGAQLVA
jgi:hypothetical protein